MRWPIQVQLLLPMLAVVTLAIVLASIASAYLGSQLARREQEQNLARVVGTLTDATFPLTETVMQKMSGLSGAEFVLFSAEGEFRSSTVPMSADELAMLPHEGRGGLNELASNPMVEIAGRQYLTARLLLPRPPASTLVVLYPEDRWWKARRQAIDPPLIAGAMTVAVAVLLTTWLARRFVRPIHRLGRHVELIAAGDFRTLELSPRNDEIRDLSVSINQMVEKLRHYEEQVRRSERLRTLGQLGAGMAHQLRNWVTGARLAVELHERECPKGDSEAMDVALRQLTLMGSYLQRFLSLGHTSSAPRQLIDLGQMLDEALTLVRPACEHGKLQLHVKTPDALISRGESPGSEFAQEGRSRQRLQVLGDFDSLRQMILNLLLNAVDAAQSQRTSDRQPGDRLPGDRLPGDRLPGDRAPGDRAPAVSVELSARPDRAGGNGHWLLLSVRDTGPGPAAEIQDRVFEAFVSAKKDGSGLGLFVAKQVAEEHGGTIGWRRIDGETEFFIELPCAEGAELPFSEATQEQAK